jgi:formamidopyrimidine-DNA glycosylase
MAQGKRAWAVPELPEVETLRRDLGQAVVGKRLEGVVVTGLRSIRRHPDPAEFVGRLVGRQICAVERRGKYLLVGLDSGDALVVHLGMSGQLLTRLATEAPVKHSHVILDFGGGPQVQFVDPRTFGEMFIALPSGRGPHPALSHLGAEPLDEALTWCALARMLGARRTQLKAVLMDQRFLAGIGNIYSDEILFAARLRYDRGSDTLSANEVQRLHRAMVGILSEAIGKRGSSLADLQYRDLFGQVGSFQHHHQVYDREGQACGRCGSKIVRVKAVGRSHFFCRGCQT